MKQKILLTGASGFIGSYLLRSQDFARLFEFLPVSHQNLTRDLDVLPKADIVIHLAGKTGILDSWNHVHDYYNSNVGMTIDVLEYCRKHGAQLIFPSTFVYRRTNKQVFCEDSELGPDNPYGQSKWAAENIASAYCRKYGFPTTVLRLANIYGFGQSKTFVIPTIVEQVFSREHEEIVVRDLSPRRDYLYIDDLLSAVQAAIGVPGFNVLNISSGVASGVESLIKAMLKAADISKSYHSLCNDSPSKEDVIILDNSLAEKVISWKPRINIEEGMGRYLAVMKQERRHG